MAMLNDQMVIHHSITYVPRTKSVLSLGHCRSASAGLLAKAEGELLSLGV